MELMFGACPLCEAGTHNPAHKFYVDAVYDRQFTILAGPFDTHAEAVAAKPEAERLFREKYASDPRIDFLAFGTMGRVPRGE